MSEATARSDSDERSDSAEGTGSADRDEMDPGRYDSPEDAPQELLDEIERERKERLDPENRPENAEVDNTDRDFEPEIGQFTDHDPDPELGPFNTEDEA